MSRETRNLIREALLRQAHEEDQAMAKNIERLLYHIPEELKAMADDPDLKGHALEADKAVDSLYTRATYWKVRAERAEQELSDRKQDLLEARAPRSADLERIKTLEAQLPEGMKESTIRLKACEVGHRRLVPDNWLDLGCDVCAIKTLERQLSAAVERAENLERMRVANAKEECSKVSQKRPSTVTINLVCDGPTATAIADRLSELVLLAVGEKP